jgi:hypothetical protein
MKTPEEIAREIIFNWEPESIVFPCNGEAVKACQSDMDALGNAITQAINIERSRSQKLKEALEFYADRHNWALLEDSSNMRSEISADDLQEFRPKKAEYCGGQRARKALAEYEGEK